MLVGTVITYIRWPVRRSSSRCRLFHSRQMKRPTASMSVERLGLCVKASQILYVRWLFTPRNRSSGGPNDTRKQNNSENRNNKQTNKTPTTSVNQGLHGHIKIADGPALQYFDGGVVLQTSMHHMVVCGQGRIGCEHTLR